MKGLSLRGRLTIWYTVALLAALLIFAAIVVWQQGRIGVRRVDSELADLIDTLVSITRDEIRENAPAPAQEAIDTVSAREHAFAILDEAGRTMAASWKGLVLPTPLPGAAGSDRTWTAGSWRVHAHPERFGDRTYVLIAGSPLTDVQRERREVQEAMVVGIPIAVLLAALGGLWLASIGLRPIHDMASRAAGMPLNGMEDLGESDRADELGVLARAFNGLLDRLRTALQTQRQFMADASHELRTPVSVIRTAADVTLARDHRLEREYREALAIVDDQARRVAQLVDDMLVLARADSGGYRLEPMPLYLDDLIADCRRTAAVLAAERGVTIATGDSYGASDTTVSGDEALLRRLLLNVVQNAVQHAPPGSTVTVRTAAQHSAAAIDVSNVAEGAAIISAADRERIFERFVQLDPSRRVGGAGLGLPIARWIATAHGGSVTVLSSDAAATVFRITLPLAEREISDLRVQISDSTDVQMAIKSVVRSET